jgi:biofilm PGA synthesis N-glycosyltransferase PgaC
MGTIYYFINAINNWELEGLDHLVANVMLYYLIFSLGRTIILLVLAFLEVLFKKNREDIKTYPLVTILVPCYNEELGIESAILSLLKIDYPNKEILILDDGSRDRTLEIAKKFERNECVRVIYKQNSGKALTLNRGIQEALGDYVLCMDADSVLSTNVLKKAISYFESDKKLGAVAGSVQVGNTKSLLASYQKLEYIIGLNFVKAAQSYLNIVNIVPGPIGVFKRDALLEVGLYHHDTFAEDADLSVRLLMAGYHINYCPEMLATTEVPEKLDQLIIQRYRWSRGITQAILKNLKWLSPRNFKARNFSIILYMLMECVAMPLINFCMAMFTIVYSLTNAPMQFLGPFFLGLTILDFTVTLFAVVSENGLYRLTIMAILNRVTFGFSMEILRFFSFIDEIFGIPMKWGQLERKGLE